MTGYGISTQPLLPAASTVYLEVFGENHVIYRVVCTQTVTYGVTRTQYGIQLEGGSDPRRRYAEIPDYAEDPQTAV